MASLQLWKMFNKLSRHVCLSPVKLSFMQSISRLHSSGKYTHLKVEKRGEKGNVLLIQLNRPKAFNALCDAVISELGDALRDAETDKDVGAVVITGSSRAFSVGDDIKEMTLKSAQDVISTNFPTFDISLTRCRKVLLAAVDGYALGGGCELALMCDIIYAGENAQFGQPEITIGTIPGAGATQRLVRAIGKSKAMELILTGNKMSAHEAARAGLISKVFPSDKLLEETLKTAEKMTGFSKTALAVCKECINKGFELSLTEGIHFERKMFQALMSTNDRREGMEAFVEKRIPVFKDC